MKIYKLTDTLLPLYAPKGSDDTVAAPCVATIGMFDGVHRGHRYLLKRVIEMAREQGMQSTVITFDRHPRQVLHSDFQPSMLSTFDEKLLLLSKTGVDNCIILPFDEHMAALPAYDFMQQVLVQQLNVRTLLMGYDNRFGHDRTETFDDYARYGRKIGIDVQQGQAFVLNGVNVSSSVIRSFLSEGEAELAEMCLGYPYTLAGHVVKGEHIGTGIGFPTANLQVDDNWKLIPAPGVYAVKVRLEGSLVLRHAMMNIGTRPTFDGKKQTIETHIFRLSDDLYGQWMAVSLMHRLRAERKFSSKEELIKQLQKDAEMVERQMINGLTNGFGLRITD